MSIYVSVCCIGVDTELVKTIENCKESAGFPNDIYFGISYTGEELFFEKLKNDLSHIENITFKFTPVENNLGIGKGRLGAASLYSDQDFFLQIDPHSRFVKNWDVFLINQFNAATQIVKNEKVVLSGTLAPYYYNKDEEIERVELIGLSYNSWIVNDFMINKTIPKWTDCLVNELPFELIKTIDKTGFAPLPKIVAMFMFGDKNLAKNISITEDILFWEEEIIQSIELINNGFSLVFPGRVSPIFHFYHNNMIDDRGKRDGYKTFLKNKADVEVYENRMSKNFNDYINNKDNFKKIKEFEKYNQISLKEGVKKKHLYPKEYANLGFF